MHFASLMNTILLVDPTFDNCFLTDEYCRYSSLYPTYAFESQDFRVYDANFSSCLSEYSMREDPRASKDANEIAFAIVNITSYDGHWTPHASYDDQPKLGTSASKLYYNGDRKKQGSYCSSRFPKYRRMLARVFHYTYNYSRSPASNQSQDNRAGAYFQ